MKRYALPAGVVLCLALLLVGLYREFGYLLPLPTVGSPTDYVIVYETKLDKPLSQEMVAVLTKAPELGVKVWDQHVTGPDRKPSPTAQPFLDAAKGHPLPVLLSRWPGGGITVEACPTTVDALKKEVGK
jgi:hypothetical protein